MKQFIMFFVLFSLFNCSFAFGAIEGLIEKSSSSANTSGIKSKRIVDSKSAEPISKATVKIPKKNFMITTDDEGYFDFDSNLDSKTILSVEKKGYKPFSMTIDKSAASRPFTIGIEKTNPFDIVIDTNMYHIGDDVFSGNSANAEDFNTKSIGPFLTKVFTIKNVPQNKNCYLKIGSIIGLDTLMAKQLGQTQVKFAYSSPCEVFFNSNMIAQLQINGDNQKIPIPKNLIRTNGKNELTIKTGKNLFQTAYVDYDDIELMNLSIEFE